MMVSKGLHREVLLGLSGIKSSCIYKNPEELRAILTRSELALLREIVEIGELYCDLLKFVKEMRKDPSDGGQYLSVLSKHLLESCQSYKEELIDLEQQMHDINLNVIYSRIYPYREFFLAVNSLLNSISYNELRGVAVLQRVYEQLFNYVRSTKEAFKRLAQGLNVVLIKQLQNWLLYGEIIDQHGEFFIRKIPPDDSSTFSLTPFRQYVLVPNYIPSFIKPTLAEKLLTVGQTVRFLRSNPDIKVEGSLVDSTGITGSTREAAQKQFLKLAQSDPEDLWKEFEKLVVNLSQATTKQLHMFATCDDQLNEQLHLVKDFLLLGRGELFHEYVVQTDAYLNRSSSKSLEFDLNQTLKECARKVLISENNLHQFSIEVQNGEIGFRYCMPWPLELLFTSAHLATYNRVYRFLLRIKRVQVHMVQAWIEDKSRRSEVGVAETARRQLQQNLWVVINNFQYYLQVDVLDSQFAKLEAAIEASRDFDEIQKAHSLFLQAIESQTFQDSPEDPLAPQNPAQLRINNILSLCEDFNYALKAARSSKVELDLETIGKFSAKFNACFGLLLKLLTELERHWGHPCCQYLSQLLLRLDFNHYFSKKLLTE